MKLIALLTLLFITQTAYQQEVNSQISCDEKKISESDEVRRTAENSLVNAVSVNAALPSGIDITAFYSEGKLIKISTTDNLSHSEQIFFDKDIPRCYERSGYDNGKEYFTSYYIQDNSIFCKQNKLSGRYLELESNEATNIILKIEEYLAAVQ